MRIEVRIAGFGGQGVALTGMILGKALAIYEELEVVMTQAYGPEARGGASSANLVISDGEIAYPLVQHPDILVTLSQEAYSKFRPTARNGATIIIDNDLVKPDPQDRVLCVPATKLAEGLGRRIVANVVMLGFFTAATSIVSKESVETAIKSTVKQKTIPLNIQAFQTGYDYANSEPIESMKGINMPETAQ